MNWMPDQQGWLSSSVTTKLIEPGRFSSGSSGDREGIEDAIVWKRRFQYEDEVRKNPLNYDYWFDYIRINYAELDAGDMEQTRDVYSECLKLIPHKKFSFAKIWLLAAQFEIRQLNLNGARQILGNAIGKAPKDKIF
ncbi:hypothetical protein Q3G72_018449 [Acer saccharum]|nr:hypothetical protein Q3G72_018449 [Acer saccharum]